MFTFDKFYFVFFAILVLQCSNLSKGIAVEKNEQLLSGEEKRGAASENRNEISSEEDPSGKSKTAKRGLLIGGNNRYGIDGLSPPGYGDYEPGRYGGNGGYPYSDDRGPPIYEPDGPPSGYHHSGDGFIGRPSGYGHGGYGPSYGPPHGPFYHGEYDDEPYHHGHSGGGEQGIGGFKALTLKKILIPLAGLAILGVAAAASQNPILLQLGTVSGRRKRSLLPTDTYPSNPVVKPLKSD